MSEKKHVIEHGLDAVTNAVGWGLDTTYNAIDSVLGGGSKSSSSDSEVTVTKNDDGSTTVNIPKDSSATVSIKK